MIKGQSFFPVAHELSYHPTIPIWRPRDKTGIFSGNLPFIEFFIESVQEELYYHDYLSKGEIIIDRICRKSFETTLFHFFINTFNFYHFRLKSSLWNCYFEGYSILPLKFSFETKNLDFSCFVVEIKVSKKKAWVLDVDTEILAKQNIKYYLF